MFKFITRKPLWVNIMAAIGIVLVALFVFIEMLSFITQHNKTEKVPSVIGQNIDAARQALTAKGFHVQVIDSVYDNTIGALAVAKQSPDADAQVKLGRTIYLTVNRASAPEVSMPNLIGFSIKSAQMYLQTLGLKMGDTTYKPDIARNAVLEQRYNGSSIKPGTKLPVGSVISFVLGSGIGSGEYQVPDLIGLTLAQARNQLNALNINIGSIVPMDNVSDTLNAFIVKQIPEVFTEVSPGTKVHNVIHQGQVIDVFISSTPPPARDSALRY
ncbi:MAG: PASTA domain-containing protein [Hydrotalea sp. AMD]|uniref:PASTA domain-containing protein n=1 Tax=Hydrotalea sp. AMD TaxID=2501297 RepID=UPI0009467311|nr:PASTA domain-containing protein [Hydrotalea sp. AMD]RWZ90840.1 MAG: PASTA domain-containing protein [Hydrotalea sp. AMD]